MIHREIDLSHVLDYRGKHAHPHYATRNAAGLDLTAELDEPHELPPGAISRIPTGLWLSLPDDVELQVRPRSGLAWLNGVTVLNAPGTVDPDYKDEVAVLLINHGPHTVFIQPGQKIAQAVLAPIYRAVQGFTAGTKERAGGFGSTGA
jgi:dUTP pyrophosphatase